MPGWMTSKRKVGPEYEGRMLSAQGVPLVGGVKIRSQIRLPYALNAAEKCVNPPKSDLDAPGRGLNLFVLT
jgi:hypothetical protein